MPLTSIGCRPKMCMTSGRLEADVRTATPGLERNGWERIRPLMPNEAYFRNVDAMVEIARRKGVVISMTLFHQRYRESITVENARAWATWVAPATRD